MPRKPRLNIADGVYHVTQRGLEKRDIVKDALAFHSAPKSPWLFGFSLATLRDMVTTEQHR